MEPSCIQVRQLSRSSHDQLMRARADETDALLIHAELMGADDQYRFITAGKIDTFLSFVVYLDLYLCLSFSTLSMSLSFNLLSFLCPVVHSRRPTSTVRPHIAPL